MSSSILSGMFGQRDMEISQSRSRADDSHGFLVPLSSMLSASGMFEVMSLSLMIQSFVSSIRPHMIVKCYHLPGITSDRLGINDVVEGRRQLDVGVSEFGISLPKSMSCCSGLVDLDHGNHYCCQGEDKGKKTDDGLKSGGSRLDWCGPSRAYRVVHGRVGGCMRARGVGEGTE